MEIPNTLGRLARTHHGSRFHKKANKASLPAGKSSTVSTTITPTCPGGRTNTLAMKFFLALAIISISCAVTMAEEYVDQKELGPPHHDLVVTHYFFSGEECYGAKREIRRRGFVVPVTETKWNFYYGGKLLATIVLFPTREPHGYEMEYIKVPAGMEFSKVRTNPKAPFDDPESLSGFKLANDKKILRVWNLSKNGLRLLSQSDLEGIEARDSKVPNTQIDAPTKNEAEATMQKVIDGVAPNLSEVPLPNSSIASPQIIEKANKPAQTDGDKPSN